jgi:hypothetical protein
MNRKIHKTGAFAAVILCVGAVTAFAASNPPQLGVKKGSVNGVNRAAGVNGALKANAVGNRQLKFGSVSCGKLSADLAAALCNGKAGTPGTSGAPGANGINGSPGKNGDTGDHGNSGVTGSSGTNGDDGGKGDKGEPAANTPTQYGVATVNVKRGAGADSAWATYSTGLGSPVGDTMGGTFRFTCATAPCEVSVKAAVLGSTDHAVYPRVLIQRQDISAGGPSVHCEYGDGSTGASATATDGLPAPVTHQVPSATPTYTAMQLNIGGSADCGVVGPGYNVDAIIVPAGRYDVQSTFVFRP